MMLLKRKGKVEERIFIFYWLNGTKSELIGTSAADAFSKAGYGAGALRAVDVYVDTSINEQRYVRNEDNTNWVLENA